jgi:hypothetical protein
VRVGAPQTRSRACSTRCRKRTFAAACCLAGPSIPDLIQIALNTAESLCNTAGTLTRARKKQLTGFKASAHWVTGFLDRRQLPLHRAHPVSMTKFKKARRAKKHGRQSSQELDMCWSIADLRAKRRLLAETADARKDRITLQDEMRISSAILFNKGRCKVLVDGRNKDESRQRACVPTRVSLSFPSHTLILTVALDGSKLAPTVIAKQSRSGQAKVPTKADIVHNLGLDPQSVAAAAIPAHPIVLTATQSTFNNSTVHSSVYLPEVLQPFQKSRFPSEHQAKGAPAPAPAAPQPAGQKPPPLEREPINHTPRNTRAYGSFSKYPRPKYGEVHDIFGGHISKRTRAAYSKDGVFTSVIASCCTGFLQWNDVYLHHKFRPLLADELRRMMRLLPADKTRLTEVEWREMLLVGICNVWYNTDFQPPAQTLRECRALGLALSLGGDEDQEMDVRLYKTRINSSRIQQMSEEREAELRAQLEAEAPPAVDEESDDSEDDVAEEEGEPAEVTADEFRHGVAAGMQVALLVDGKQAGVRFQIGDVCDGEAEGDGKVKVHWYSGATVRSGATGKWSPDFNDRHGKVPEVEARDRDNIIPVPLQWKEFERGKGGYLHKRSIVLIEEWIDMFEIHEQLFEEEPEAAIEESMGTPSDEGKPEMRPQVRHATGRPRKSGEQVSHKRRKKS